MALADYNSLNNSLIYPSQHCDYVKQLNIPVALATFSNASSTWLGTGNPGAGVAPGASSVPTNLTAGAIPIVNASGIKELRAWINRFNIARSDGLNSQMPTIMLCDRLVHMSGLDGTSVAAQSVATSALTRSTSGIGVMAAIEIYVQLGATQTTFTCSYTNDAGISGKTSQPMSVGGAGANAVGKIIPISLAAGDRGVRAVSTVTLLASTLTAGNFGITLYRPLTPPIPLDIISQSIHPLLSLGGYAPLIDSNACLFFIIMMGGSVTARINSDIQFFED